MLKYCRKCGTDKELDQFYKNKTSRDGYTSQCKQCLKDYAFKNKYRISEQRKEYHQRIKNGEIKKPISDFQKTRKPINLLTRRIISRFQRATKILITVDDIPGLIGCDIGFYKYYIESQFTEGMNWQNSSKWEIDHIIPCCSFDLNNPEQVKICFHYKNTRPLWAYDNRKKGKKDRSMMKWDMRVARGKILVDN